MTISYLFSSVSGLREVYTGGNEQTRMVSTLEQWLFLSGEGVEILLGILVRMCYGVIQIPPGGLPYKSDRDAHRKIQTEPLRETNVGVAQA